MPPAADFPGHPDPAWDDDRLGQASWRDHLDPGWQPGPDHRHDDHGQAGHQLDGYDQGGYDQGGYDQGGYDQAGYDQAGYDSYGPTGYGHDGYAPLPTASYEVDATGGYGRDQPGEYDHTGHDQDHTGAHDATGWLDGTDGHHDGRADDDTVVHRASRRRGRRTDDVDDADGPGSGRRRRGVPGPVALAALVAVLLVAIGGGAALLRSGFSDGSGTGTDQGGVAASGGTSVTDPPLDTTGATAEPQIGDPQARAELGPAPTPSAQPSSAAPPPPPDPDPVRTTEPAAPAPTRTTPAAPARTSAAPPSSATGGGNLEQQVLTIVNQERGANGCGPVTINTRLSEASRLHSEDQAATDNMSHEGSDGSSPWERAERAGYDNAIGENVAAGYPTAAAVMDGWMNSAGHRANILNCDAVAMGVGTARSADGTLYWTQMFGSVA
ncbi:CAP domain-containing protein [Solwaraspora sp. WMMA2056]|uniref:CAP domain-containing protein n=1 Tax=Solwaraspora sp. WMMA2056 TaxID=3015161 RepID=UPI00259B1813|nr:CAP domain-containing protein [Solwaraspora sp. WMMA2056]WJK40023.1 CAP domain-containing protein [Solwaraspora sp. WMMA2056]